MTNTQDNHSDQEAFAGYASYQSPTSPPPQSYDGQIKGGGFLRNPILATAALLIGASALAGVIILATPNSDDAEILPIIKADTTPIKMLPDDPGGMEIPHKDSTVFDRVTSGDSEVISIPAQDTDSYPEAITVPSDAKAVKLIPSRNAPTKTSETIDLTQGSKDVRTSNVRVADKDETSAPTKKLLSASAGNGTYTKPKTIHPAGASPETLAFIKSALEDTRTQAVKMPSAEFKPKPVPSAPKAVPAPARVAKKPVAAKPARTPASKVAPKASGKLTHYVQLASIKDAAKAQTQWTRLQGKYAGALAGSGHRVQKKEIAGKGTFYRIQAGPFTKADASAKCDMIKKTTPAGCYLVAQ